MSSEPPKKNAVFDATRVDLGDDLLAPRAPLPGARPSGGKSANPAEDSERALRGEPVDLDDRLESARILVSEGFLEEAKKVLRSIVLADPNQVIARKRLEEIQRAELERIFNSPPTRAKGKSVQLDSEAIMRELDRDLGLGVFGDGDTGEALKVELQFFGTTERRDAYAQSLEKLARDLAPIDRLDLGIAFFEMGLYSLAAKLAQAAGQGDLRASAGSLQAQALILAGKPFEATFGLEALLSDQEIAAEQKIDFMYLLGRANEKLAQPARALEWYERVIELDGHYRDTWERRRRLIG